MTSSTTGLKLEAGIEERLSGRAPAPGARLMREAIEQYIEREEARERLGADALAAWADFERTGKHISADEADAWLSRLEAGEDADPPTSHRF